MGSKKIIVPQGLINPNETTIIEIPAGVDSEATLIARASPYEDQPVPPCTRTTRRVITVKKDSMSPQRSVQVVKSTTKIINEMPQPPYTSDAAYMNSTQSCRTNYVNSGGGYTTEGRVMHPTLRNQSKPACGCSSPSSYENNAAYEVEALRPSKRSKKIKSSGLPSNNDSRTCTYMETTQDVRRTNYESPSRSTNRYIPNQSNHQTTSTNGTESSNESPGRTQCRSQIQNYSYNNITQPTVIQYKESTSTYPCSNYTDAPFCPAATSTSTPIKNQSYSASDAAQEKEMATCEINSQGMTCSKTCPKSAKHKSKPKADDEQQSHVNLSREVKRQLAEIEENERQQINRDLSIFQQARRKLFEDTALLSASEGSEVRFQ